MQTVGRSQSRIVILPHSVSDAIRIISGMMKFYRVSVNVMYLGYAWMNVKMNEWFLVEIFGADVSKCSLSDLLITNELQFINF